MLPEPPCHPASALYSQATSSSQKYFSPKSAFLQIQQTTFCFSISCSLLSPASCKCEGTILLLYTSNKRVFLKLSSWPQFSRSSGIFVAVLLAGAAEQRGAGCVPRCSWGPGWRGEISFGFCAVLPLVPVMKRFLSQQYHVMNLCSVYGSPQSSAFCSAIPLIHYLRHVSDFFFQSLTLCMQSEFNFFFINLRSILQISR